MWSGVYCALEESMEHLQSLWEFFNDLSMRDDTIWNLIGLFIIMEMIVAFALFVTGFRLHYSLNFYVSYVLRFVWLEFGLVLTALMIGTFVQIDTIDFKSEMCGSQLQNFNHVRKIKIERNLFITLLAEVLFFVVTALMERSTARQTESESNESEASNCSSCSLIDGSDSDEEQMSVELEIEDSHKILDTLEKFVRHFDNSNETICKLVLQSNRSAAIMSELSQVLMRLCSSLEKQINLAPAARERYSRQDYENSWFSDL
ncbi:hypothetical protein M3Y98_00688700 [Aphelenchoides besseyi]|nr:hypothetical protein M3Y98_00688700 [Aphelenchoides besseyi]KAI6209016.1 hypothetical protein M3Y96_00176400 [Aphelenchoides besseyi]